MVSLLGLLKKFKQNNGGEKMKCPECSLNHKRSVGMVCSCGYSFVFCPKSSDAVTDGKFLALINKISGNGTYYFTPLQFHLQYCTKKYKEMKTQQNTGIGCFLFIAVVVFFASHNLTFALIPLGIAFLMAWAKKFDKPVSLKTSLGLLDKWKSNGREIDKLLEKPRLQNPPSECQEPDIYDYGVERILLVEHPILVDLFVLNNFHCHERVLILCQDGYPDYLGTQAEKSLEENPDLPVYLLHDASEEGERMNKNLETSSLPIQTHPIVDLGFFAKDIAQIKGLEFINRQYANKIPVAMLPYPILSKMLSNALNKEPGTIASSSTEPDINIGGIALAYTCLNLFDDYGSEGDDESDFG